MKNIKLTLAYLLILCFFIIGLIIIQEILEYNRGDEGYGILVSVIWGFIITALLALGVLSLILNLIVKKKLLPKLVWVLLSYSIITYLIPKVIYFGDLRNWILLIACIVSIYILALEIAKNSK